MKNYTVWLVADQEKNICRYRSKHLYKDTWQQVHVSGASVRMVKSRNVENYFLGYRIINAVLSFGKETAAGYGYPLKEEWKLKEITQIEVCLVQSRRQWCEE